MNSFFLSSPGRKKDWRKKWKKKEKSERWKCALYGGGKGVDAANELVISNGRGDCGEWGFWITPMPFLGEYFSLYF